MADRIALITGAGQGIGRAMALRLAAGDYHTILVGRTRAKLESVAAEITAAGGSAQVEPLDVTDSAAIRALAERLASQPALDALIHCAGEALIRPLTETTEADWDRILAVNLKAPFLLAQAFLPLLQRSANATILHIGSKTVYIGAGTLAPYTASKTGLLGLTRSLAAELRPEQIRVVLLSPGPADTPMRWAATPDFDPALLIQPEVVAEAAWHLLNLPRGVTAGDVLIESMGMM
jgi:NAD(P)-dependent dehydrogenase (short-subunit alcohol dehydrogenase family)